VVEPSGEKSVHHCFAPKLTATKKDKTSPDQNVNRWQSNIDQLHLSPPTRQKAEHYFPTCFSNAINKRIVFSPSIHRHHFSIKKQNGQDFAIGHRGYAPGNEFSCSTCAPNPNAMETNDSIQISVWERPTHGTR
jgi:hypothetical protein